MRSPLSSSSMSLLAPVSRVGVGGALLGCGTGKVLFDLITGLESLLAAAKRTKGGLGCLKKDTSLGKGETSICVHQSSMAISRHSDSLEFGVCHSCVCRYMCVEATGQHWLPFLGSYLPSFWARVCQWDLGCTNQQTPVIYLSLPPKT